MKASVPAAPEASVASSVASGDDTAVGPYYAACYVRDLLIELREMARRAELNAQSPALDQALGEAIDHANSSVNRQR